MLETKLEYIRQPRLKILELLEGFSLEQLNEIPKGFNNNIIWKPHSKASAINVPA
jgi:hypothetical protein